jgi:DNA-directed RNA polymerase specialized sigma24 family protein
MATHEITADRALIGVLVLLAADRAERDPEPRISTELILHEVGFSNPEIGSMIDEKPNTVRMRIDRAKKAKAKTKVRASE